MKNFTHRFTLFACLMLFAGTLFAQWQVKDLGTAQTSNKMYVYSSDIAFIVGNNKVLLRTTDKGETWNPVTVNLSKPTLSYGFSDIAFTDATNGFVVTKKVSSTNENGLILHSVDNGVTWNELNVAGFSNSSGDVAQDPTLGVQWNFTAIACTETTVYVALTWKNTATTTSYGYIFKSTDNGSTWTKIGNNYVALKAVTLNGIVAKGNSIYIGGSFGYFQASLDAGANWIDYTNLTTFSSINNLRLIDENTVYLATTNGTFYTTNGGSTVTPLNSIGAFDVLTFSDLGIIFAGGIKDKIVRNINGETSWPSAQEGLNGTNIWDLAFFNGNIYALCNSGIIYTLPPIQLKDPIASFTVNTLCNDVTTNNTSENCGSYSWTFGDTPNTFPDKNPSHPYTAYNTYTISLTATNAVKSATATQNVTISQPTIDFTYLPDAVNENKIAFTNTSSTCKTYSWDFKTGTTLKEVSPTYTFPLLGSFDVTLSGFDGIGTYSKTKNITIDTVAAQWSYMVTDSSKILQKLQAFNKDTAIILGNSTTIIRTTDGGNTWSNTIFPIENECFNPNDILFFNDETGFASFSSITVSAIPFVFKNGFILKTTDNGQNWSQVPLNVFSDGTGTVATDPAAATASKVTFFSMTKTSSTKGFVVVRWFEGNTATNHGYVYTTSDAGSTWSKISVDIYQANNYTKVINSIAFDAAGTTGYIGGIDLLLKSIDGGATWSKIPYSTISATKATADFGSINDMIVKDANTVYLATQFGTIKTSNGFTSGKIVAADYSFDIVAINDSTFLSGKDASTLKITHDYGTTWEPSSNGIGSSFYELAIFNNKIYALANYGKAYISLLDFYNVPVLNFTHSIADKVVTFTNQSTNTKSYEWSFGDTQTSTEVSPVHTYANYGTYSITLNGGNLCWKATPKKVEINLTQTGISTNETSNFQIWPNPTSQGVVNLSLGNAFNDDARVNIHDIQGRLISTRKIGSSRQISIDLNPGMYIVKVVGNNVSATQKLIVK